MLKIAITGNIASGKSQLEKILIDNGYLVYDTDKIAHSILDTMTEFYGYDVFTNGKIDRKKLGNLVFSDNKVKKELEDLIHPLVKQKILELFEKHKNDKYVFVSVPLLYESGFDSMFDKVILVTIDKNTQLNRLILRNNLTKEDALKRINAQIPQEEKIEKADFIIDNNSTIENLKEKLNHIIKELEQ